MSPRFSMSVQRPTWLLDYSDPNLAEGLMEEPQSGEGEDKAKRKRKPGLHRSIRLVQEGDEQERVPQEGDDERK